MDIVAQEVPMAANVLNDALQGTPVAIEAGHNSTLYGMTIAGSNHKAFTFGGTLTEIDILHDQLCEYDDKGKPLEPTVNVLTILCALKQTIVQMEIEIKQLKATNDEYERRIFHLEYAPFDTPYHRSLQAFQTSQTNLKTKIQSVTILEGSTQISSTNDEFSTQT